jgi:hypothetical protein
MPVSHETLWSTVPTGGNVLSQRWVIVQASATTEVSEFNDISRDQDILSIHSKGWLKNSCYLRFYISMKNGILMHVLNGLQ